MIHNLPQSRPATWAIAAFAALAVMANLEPALAKNLRDDTQEETVPSRTAGTPLMAIVSLSDQRISIYDAEGRILRAPVSSGQTGYETPVGLYSVLQKEAEHYSNVYDDASMPFMQRLTWSGVALHAGVLPGYPASHGCVRMPHTFAGQLFELTKLGMRVVVAPNDVAPAAITHSLLPKPKPASSDVAVATQTAYQPEESSPDPAMALEPDVKRWPARQMQIENLKTIAEGKSAEAEAVKEKAEEVRRTVRAANGVRAKAIKAVKQAEYAKRRADEKLADIEKWLLTAKDKAIQQAQDAKVKADAKVAEAQTKLDAAKAEEQTATEAATRATEELKTADAAKDAVLQAAAEAGRAMLPVSAFISLKTQRLYVRQGREQILDVPVTIRDPQLPIGTHIFTALAYGEDGNDVQWNVVSIASSADYSGQVQDDGKRRKSKNRSPEAEPTDAAAATSALDRVTIPQEAMDRMAQHVWPGSSLIISDEQASKETGKGTEFVVLLTGYAQGGIKKRKRPPTDPYFDYYSDRYDRSYRPFRGSPKFGWW